MWHGHHQCSCAGPLESLQHFGLISKLHIVNIVHTLYIHCTYIVHTLYILAPPLYCLYVFFFPLQAIAAAVQVSCPGKGMLCPLQVMAVRECFAIVDLTWPCKEHYTCGSHFQFNMMPPCHTTCSACSTSIKYLVQGIARCTFLSPEFHQLIWASWCIMYFHNFQWMLKAM